MKISIWKTKYDEMPYCVFCRDYIHNRTHYVVNSKEHEEEDDEFDSTIMSLCSDCFDKLIELKKEVDKNDDFVEIYK